MEESDSKTDEAKLRMVKRIALGMTLLIGLGLMVLAYGFMRQGEKLGKPETPVPGKASVATAAAVAVADFGEVMLGEPDGSLIHDMQSDGTRLVLRIRGGGKGERVVVVSLADGKVLGRIALNHAK